MYATSCYATGYSDDPDGDEEAEEQEAVQGGEGEELDVCAAGVVVGDWEMEPDALPLET